jgi:hypothetical protein
VEDEEGMMATKPVVRVSIARCAPERFPALRDMMAVAETVLVPGIKAMKGCHAYFAGADEATSSLTNVSVWESLEAAQQMDRFGPMLDLGRKFVEMGATFERPIMNHEVLWDINVPPQWRSR